MSRKGTTIKTGKDHQSLGLGVRLRINANGHKTSLWGDINDLKLHYSNGCTTI